MFLSDFKLERTASSQFTLQEEKEFKSKLNPKQEVIFAFLLSYIQSLHVP